MSRNPKHEGRAYRMGVILANTGTPASPAPRAVRKYLAQFLMDPRIRPMNPVLWWMILHMHILPIRGKASGAKYAEIWTEEGSPLLVMAEKLARGMQAAYDEEGRSVAVRAAMSYGKPSYKQVVKELKGLGCEKIVVVPMYPQNAFSTAGSVIDGVTRAVRRCRYQGKVEIVPDYSEDPVYVQAIAASVRHSGFDADAGDRLLFSYHSIPLADIEHGDNYELKTGATSLAVAGELALERRQWTISYQSRFDKGRMWLNPFTRPTLERLARAAEPGSRLFMVCPNFSIDCLETLYDIPYELEPLYRNALPAECRHADAFVYVPCLNHTKAHLKVLEHLLDPYVKG